MRLTVWDAAALALAAVLILATLTVVVIRLAAWLRAL